MIGFSLVANYEILSKASKYCPEINPVIFYNDYFG